jgi:hypothetical protein
MKTNEKLSQRITSLLFEFYFVIFEAKDLFLHIILF